MYIKFQIDIAKPHDDAIKWKHFPRYWPFVQGIARSPVNSPHKGQWRGAVMFSLICFWLNGRVNKREAGDLRRYRAHYDLSVMCWNKPEILRGTNKPADIDTTWYNNYSNGPINYAYWLFITENNGKKTERVVPEPRMSMLYPGLCRATDQWNYTFPPVTVLLIRAIRCFVFSWHKCYPAIKQTKGYVVYKSVYFKQDLVANSVCVLGVTYLWQGTHSCIQPLANALSLFIAFIQIYKRMPRAYWCQDF